MNTKKKNKMVRMLLRSSLEMSVGLGDLKIAQRKIPKTLITLPAAKTWKVTSQVGVMIGK